MRYAGPVLNGIWKGRHLVNTIDRFRVEEAMPARFVIAAAPTRSERVETITHWYRWDADREGWVLA